MLWGRTFVVASCMSGVVFLGGCGGSSGAGPTPASPIRLSVRAAGTGSGTIASSPAGINCGTTCSASFNSGTQATLTATPAANSSFIGWSGACSGTATCTLTLSSNSSVTATFSAAPTLTVSLAGTGSGTIASSPAGINCGTTCSAGFTAGSQVTLAATANPGSAFAGWSGACSSTTTASCTLTLNSSTSVTANFTLLPTLAVQVSGTGAGTVTSNPAGVNNCAQSCTAGFNTGTQVALTAAPASNSYFVGWGGACSGTGACGVTVTANQQVTAIFNLNQNVSALNHIIFLAQENRSLDHYFGELRQYWADNGYPDQSFDGLPQFNPTSGTPPLQGPAPAVPGCNPGAPFPASDCIFDPTNPVSSFHLITQCVENPSPSWNESHVDWDYNDPTGLHPAPLNGFVWTTGHDSRSITPPFIDTNGLRVMGYYDGSDLNYYYFMASNFATSDRWFSPVMSRTNPNREYLIGGTSYGYAYPNGTNSQDMAQIPSPMIFEELQNAGVSWKLYVYPNPNAVTYSNGLQCAANDTRPQCLYEISYIQNFTYGQTILNQYPQNIVPISQFYADAQNGTLPQVAQIEPASAVGLDEHAADYDTTPPCCSVQAGAAYVKTLVDALMGGPSWKDSAFILTYDEFGGFYDHIAPQPMPLPGDFNSPVDLFQGPPPNGPDVCVAQGGPTCGFQYTGYRVPLIVISPYTKKNYVSHTAADTTSILKLIETRFGLPPLTHRDAGQMDMSEFFDFNNPSWLTPPTPPSQDTSGACYLTSLP